MNPDGSAPDFPVVSDTGPACPDPSGDDDGDGISNALEGCLTGRDTDGDKAPDWRDLDSDGDGLKDGDEDLNGDGQLGCCLQICNAPDAKWQKANCMLTTDGCGNGQKCTNKACIPSAAFLCSKGETSPIKKDTFGQGNLDSQHSAFICRDAAKDNPLGLRALASQKNTAGDWHLALQAQAKYTELKISGAGGNMAAAAVDFDQSSDEVAGFILSRPTSSGDIQTEHVALIQAVLSALAGAAVIRASGTLGKSHDKFDQIRATTMELTPANGLDISSARNRLVAAMLGKKVSDLSNLPAKYGGSHTSLVLRFSTVRRFAFKKDASGTTIKDSKGYPQDDGDKSKWRLVVLGAVTAKASFLDPKLRSGMVMDDLSNGTALARTSGVTANACDVFKVRGLPQADIIWVMDESSSMNNKHQDTVNTAANFFSRALASGLDFRMAVVNATSPATSGCLGKFCSRISTNPKDDGGVDRFLLPTEASTFTACMQNPACNFTGSSYSLLNAREAVKRHLPRAANDPTRIRKAATLVIIVATDTAASSLSSLGYGASPCPLATAAQAKLDTALQPYLAYFTGQTDAEATAMYHIIGGVCGQTSTCSAQMNHGHMTLASKLGGQYASICQKNLGNTLQMILDTLDAGDSPMKLAAVPISASMALTVDGLQIPRSRTQGFDYRNSGNALVLINVKYSKGSEIVSGYKRWMSPGS